VVKDFIARVNERAVGQEVIKALKPGQALIKVVHEELKHVLGDEQAPLALDRPPGGHPAGRPAGRRQDHDRRQAGEADPGASQEEGLLASCDVYRPAAIDQLETLAGQVEAGFFRSDEAADPVRIAEDAVGQARRQFADVLILDTAGRLAVDEAMMDEIRRVHAAVDPAEVLFVVDAMTGQDAANTAKAFHEALPLTGVVLTKTDGDARGGAALSVRQITGAPIKFLGTGEKIDGLEPFHPDRLASRILGMGDVLSLVEEVERKVDQKQARKLAGKVGKASKRFGLDDFRDQLLQMDKLGGMGALMDKLPGMGNLPEAVKSQVDDRQTREWSPSSIR
jgi:signal recognition particle subunit SRP54